MNEPASPIIFCLREDLIPCVFYSFVIESLCPS